MSPTTSLTTEPLVAPPRRQSPPRRMGWIVVLGVILLGGTGVGAVLLNQGSPGDAKKIEAQSPVNGVLASGVADADPKVADLNPSQMGPITWIIAEGTQAKKGDVLLKIDNGSALKKVEAAKAALSAAQAKLEEAKKGPDKHMIMEKNLELAIKGAIENRAIAEAELKAAQKAFKLTQIPQTSLDIADANFKRSEAAVSAEENKRFELILSDPKLLIRQAEAAVLGAQAQLDEANWLLQLHDLKAPFDGTVLRVLVSVGELNGPVPKVPAIQFCPSTPRIVRAEVLQEWAHLVQAGQEAIVEDDTKMGYKWKGRVKSVSDWFTDRRSRHLEPFTFNDVRTLECIIEIVEGDRPLRIGQRVSINIVQDSTVKAPQSPQ